MCGFLLQFDPSGSEKFFDFNQAMLLQHHRGPDRTSKLNLRNNTLMVGHNRLAIIETSQASDQPFKSVDGRFTLIFNGEIYNYKSLRDNLKSAGIAFRTTSDTEVLLAGLILQGVEFLDKINGMFSFALYDSYQDEIIFGRDEGGEKPLFFHKRKNKLIISTNLFSIVKITKDARVSDRALAEFLIHGYPLNNSTLLSSIEEVSPGLIKRFCLKSGTLKTIHKQTAKPQISGQGLHKKLRNAVYETFESDVPACISLSGGLDSSLLVALAKEELSEINTFSIIFKGYGECDESKLSRLISKHFNTNHIEIEMNALTETDVISAFEHIDTPIIDSSILPTFKLYKSISEHYKVALGGDGADELFGGYKHLQRYKFMKFALSIFNNRQSRDLIKSIAPTRFENISNWIAFFDTEVSRKNLRSFAYGPTSAPEKLHKFFGEAQSQWASGSCYSNIDDLRFLIIADYENYLKKSILVKTDRCAMANSVEARSPFLHQSLRDRRWTIKYGEDFSLNKGKLNLIRLAQSSFPKTYPFGYKRGFNLPLDKFLVEGKAEVIWSLFFANDIGFEKKYLDNLHKSIITQNSKRLVNLVFGIALLNFWIRKVRAICIN